MTLDTTRAFIQAHPILVVLLAPLMGAIVNDLHNFLKWSKWEDAVAFDWQVATFNYAKAIVSGFLGVVGLATAGTALASMCIVAGVGVLFVPASRSGRRRWLTIVILAIVGATAACGSARHVAVQVDASVSAAVFAVDDFEFEACQKQLLSAATCADLNPKIKAALEDVRTVTAALQATPKTGSVPKSLPTLLQTLRDVQQIAQSLPPSDITQALNGKINGALDAAIALLSKIAGS